MTTKAEQFVKNVAKWPFMGGIGVSSISGNGYSVSEFSDGSVLLEVGGKIIDHSPEPVTRNAIDTFAHAGRMLASYSKAERAAIIARLYGAKDCVISGVRWSADGEYLGLNW